MKILCCAALLLVLPACATLPEVPTAPDEAPTSELADRFDRRFANPVRDHDLSGVLLVREEGEVIARRTYGFADWAERTAFSPTTRFEAASVTKGITAAAVVRLQREGRLSFDDPVAKHLPVLANAPRVTIDQVLQHEAGLPRDLPDGWSGTSVAGWLTATPDVWSAPGIEAYSNVGYALLAELVEAVSGMPFAEYAQRRVLAPAGMSGALLLPRAGVPEGFAARGYSPGPGPDGLAPAISAPLEQGASGLIATPEDLAIWVEELAAGEYPEFFVGDDPLGSVDAIERDGQRYVSVQGSLPGFSANAIAWEGGRKSIVFLGNLFSYPVLTMRSELIDLAGEKSANPMAARPQEVSPRAVHGKLAGAYETADFGPVEIALDADTKSYRLSLIGKPAFWSFYLTPIEGGFHWRAFDRIIAWNGTQATMDRRGTADPAKLAPLDTARD